MTKVWFDPGTAIAGATALFSAFGTISAGGQANAQAQAQAGMYRDAASITQLEESRAHNDLNIQRQRTLSSAKATMAAQGGGVDEGILSAEAAQFGDQDARISNDSKLKQRGLFNRALYAQQAGEYAQSSSLWKAGGQALGGGYNLFKAGQMKNLY